MQEIPILDFSKLIKNGAASDEGWAEVAKEVRNACHNIGFMYIVNHGIPAETIEAAFSESRRFFALPMSAKQKCLIDAKNQYRGYTSAGQEILTPGAPFEFREAFARVGTNSRQPFPDQLPEFQVSLENLQVACVPLTKTVLKLLAKALLLEDEEYFVKTVKGLDDLKIGNRSTLRTHFYPPIPEDIEIPKGSVRCGTHSDYGTCTFLFQDSMGGLEARNANDEWIPADPIPNAVLVNLGDLMETWTNEYFRATKHRVLIPESEIRKRTARQSIAYFVAADEDVYVTKLKSSLIPENLDKDFEPFLSELYLDKKLNDTYQY